MSANTQSYLTADEALKLVSAYFDTEWPQTTLHDVVLEQVKGGFVNRLYKLTRHTRSIREPPCILIRLFGLGNKTFYEQPQAGSSTLTAAEQALIYYEMGRRGWVPKLYGLFDGGRLEEYLDAHPLTAAEACKETIRRDVARSYARLHSLELPFKKHNFATMVDELIHKANQLPPTIEKMLKTGEKEATRFGFLLRDIDWAKELKWASQLFDTHNCKPAIAVGDANFLNVLVKNYESDCSVVLIDYETCTYSYRGVDIGGHFNERMYDWGRPDNDSLTGYPAPSEEEQRDFCRAYRAELQALGGIDDADDEETLLREAGIGRMWQLLFSVAMGFPFEGVELEGPLLGGLAHMLETYLELKKEWLAKE